MKNKKYYSLYLQLKNKILSGEYPSGSKLPSKRVLADMSGFSTVTVERAYAMLEEEGYLSTRQRSGYFVTLSTAPTSTDRTVADAPLPHIKEDHAASGSRDFEYSIWFKTIRRVLTDHADELFVKADGKGCAILRNAIADYLHRYRGMTADPHSIIIGSGSEQLYEIAVKLLGRDRVFGIEDPCYSQIPAVYVGAGASVRPLRFGDDGIESTALQSGGFDVLHVTPFYSYPSGVTTSISKRYEYLAWAHATGGYIIEDDFASEFALGNHPVEPLFSLDSRHSVIYINTFSKSLSPSMRIGYMILPPELMAEYDRRLGAFSCSVPVLDQYVLAEFISSGSFERHLNRVRRRIKRGS